MTSTYEPYETTVINNGTRRSFRFANGYEASVVCNDVSYGASQGLFELAVLRDGELAYDTPITSDVIGWLTEPEVQELLGRIDALPSVTSQPVTSEPVTSPSPYWLVTAFVEYTSADGYDGSRQLPTFFLDERVQGFTTSAGACKIARTLLLHDNLVLTLPGMTSYELHLSAMRSWS